MRQDTAATKARIIAIAEKLFATKGVENVTLTEINHKAGQKNRSALQYHFGGKKELIEAIIHKHLFCIDEDRNKMLDEFEKQRSVSGKDIARAIVIPLANRLSAKGGLSYIRITAQLFGDRKFPYLHQDDIANHFSSERLWKFMRKAGLELPEPLLFTRTVVILSTLFNGLANYAQISEFGKKLPAGVNNDLFIQDLVESVEALLTKQPSAELRELLEH
ncbi:TetR/AcrR family transcriptional regulator [Endozoicomonas numazuensis]|uniref:TetR/AcrR family transcriptional regulator n=1 Tax=Endozoicomonas numazuensis TaxID=1137799 RepID=UPI000691C2C9|nr:TetR/AcrR family transcriptional regulator [Endozoicomonas numazuensis]